MMEIIWGGWLVLLGLIAWIGQLIYAISSRVGTKLGLGEAESDVDAVFYIDARAEAIWDSMILWILPLAGVLLMFQHPFWPYIALVGGGSYLYFAGRSITTRLMLQRHGIRIGTPGNVRVAYLFVSLWGLTAVITIITAMMSFFEK